MPAAAWVAAAETMKGNSNSVSLFNRATPNADIASRIDAAPQLEVANRVRHRETMEEKLRRRQAEIAVRLHDIATKKKVESRERGSRLDRIIGAACRADESMDGSIRTALKAVKSPADREFLKIEGWL
jgi:hypothetical protein